jgi:hypothetical protein
MKTTPPLKATFLRLLFLLAVILFTVSCRKNNPIEMSLKADNFSKDQTEEVEAFFLIATANVSKSIIAKSQIAQQKCSEYTIQELSKEIEDHQNQLQRDVSRLASKKLVIITEINATHKRDLYALIDANDASFKNAYLNSITESLEEQIELFESISKDTNDKTILKLVLHYLPEQYKLLRETESIQKQII